VTDQVLRAAGRALSGGVDQEQLVASLDHAARARLAAALVDVDPRCTYMDGHRIRCARPTLPGDGYGWCLEHHEPGNVAAGWSWCWREPGHDGPCEPCPPELIRNPPGLATCDRLVEVAP
jgi:hypothetical protein